MMKWLQCFLLSMMCILSACDSRKDEGSSGFRLPSDRPDSFLKFFNGYAPLADGAYQLVILPQVQESGTASGSLRIGEKKNDLAYNWSSDVDIDFKTTSVTKVDFSYEAGSDISVSANCSTACTLTIFKNNLAHYQIDSENNQIALSLPASHLDSLQYANAYYKAVDPIDERTTLDSWKTKNGFDSGHDAHLIFRDSKDLGYGRDMFAKFHDDGRLAIFVNNFVINVGPGNPASYGPTNLLAVLDGNLRFHIGTNAIEFSPIQNSDGSESDGALRIAKFFIFAPEDENGVQHRLTEADLDGRGVKHVPTTCLMCHGARMLPLNADGTFNTLSLTSAKLNQLEMDSFEFTASGIYDKATQQEAIKKINRGVHDNYDAIATRSINEYVGLWDGDFAKEVAAGRYQEADTPNQFDSNDYVATDIPEGWQQTAFRPEGVETLYKQVVEPHCINCHSIRGFTAGNDEDLDSVIINGQITQVGTAINFSTYEKFISYNDLIIDYVYRRGLMPSSLRNYERFWRFPEEAPTLLASFLPGFNVLNENSEVEEPGKPYARFGRNRFSRSPVLLNGKASDFANTYTWSIVSTPADATASLSQPNAAITELTADTDGEYEIKLSVSNSRGNHETTITITVDSQRKAGNELTFVDDVMPLLQTTLYGLRTCQSCHYSESDIESIPVHYDNANNFLYRDVRHRVNFLDADNSILIRKPASVQHGGGLRIDLETQVGQSIYSTLMNWILHGAPCGDDSTICHSLSN